MKLPASLWSTISALFDEIAELDPAARQARLAHLDAHSPELSCHVRALVDAHEQSATVDPLLGPPSELLASAMASQLGGRMPGLASGQMLGPYQLIEPIGEGGMACVWLAEQTVSVKRRVALKIPHHGLEDAAATASRFAQERDLLAALEHPRIARLYDAGASTEGIPYLAMEWIDGLPIDRYADAHRLSIEARVALFQQVLQAVRHAHSRLVLHRDIKPSNILVTPDGDVKLLDFGIARILGDAASIVQGSRIELGALTPETASPEQLAGAPLTTPSDVYSLGLVLYRLLTGAQPYRIDTAITGRSPAQLYAAVQAATIAQPSACRVQVAAAVQRGTTPDGLRRQLAGDLDAIVMKALMRQPGDRYDSAEAFSADLNRWRTHRPVSARTARSGYLVGLFILRNRAVVAGVAAVTLALSVGLGLALWEAERARQAAQESQTVQAFLVSLFEASDPQEAHVRDVSAKALLDRGAQRLDAALRTQPAQLARLSHEMGHIYLQLGDYVAARVQLEKALKLYESLGLEGSEDAIETQSALAEVLQEDMQFDAARRVSQRCLQLADANFGPGNRWQLPVQTRLGWMDMDEGHLQAGIERISKVLAEAERRDPRPSVFTERARMNIARAHADLGQYALARDEYQRVIADEARIPGVEFVDHLVNHYNLAQAEFRLRSFDQAERELQPLVADMDHHIGPQHDRTIKARAMWAQTLAELGRYDQAIDVQRQNLANAMARKSTDGEVVALQQLTVGKIFKLAARPAEGIDFMRAGLTVYDSKYPQPTWLQEIGRRVLGELLLQDGQIDQGIRTLDLGAERSARIDGYSTNPFYADLLQVRALALNLRPGRQSLDQAIAMLEQAQRIDHAAVGPDNPSSLRCDVHLAWMQALRAPLDPTSAKNFDNAARAYGATVPATHVIHAELALMHAELKSRGATGAASVARTQSEHRAALAAWRSAMGHEFKQPLLILH